MPPAEGRMFLIERLLCNSAYFNNPLHNSHISKMIPLRQGSLMLPNLAPRSHI